MEDVDVKEEHSYASPKHIKELLEAINEFKI
jgi:hypothetical protein